jgi:quercetin dioxygenase-like cupin family protein
MKNGEVNMNGSNATRWLACALGAVLLSATVSGQSKPAVPAGFTLVDAGEPLSGVIFGDPNKPGIHITRNRFLPGQGSTPHYHDEDRYITVIKGTWWVALGPDSDVYDPAKMIPMKTGSFLFEPAYGHHYDGAKDEEVIVEILHMGPSKTIPVEKPAGRP